MRISDWSSDVCSSDLSLQAAFQRFGAELLPADAGFRPDGLRRRYFGIGIYGRKAQGGDAGQEPPVKKSVAIFQVMAHDISILFEESRGRSEEHTSELQSLMRISYAVFCLKKKT